MLTIHASYLIFENDTLKYTTIDDTTVDFNSTLQ